MAISWAVTLYIHFRGFSPRSGILPDAKFTLRPKLALSYFDSITAQHSSSGRQPNFAALVGGRHLYSAGRPSHLAFAHILVLFIFMVALCNRADHYIFELWFLSFFFFSSPNLSGRRLDVYHISTHGVALVRI